MVIQRSLGFEPVLAYLLVAGMCRSVVPESVSPALSHCALKDMGLDPFLQHMPERNGVEIRGLLPARSIDEAGTSFIQIGL